MATSAFYKFQDFVEQLGKGVHQLHAAGHTLNVFLTDELPLNTDTVTGDMVPLAQGNGYAPADIINDYTESAGSGVMTAVDKEWTAVTASFGPFRYAVIYNDSVAGKNLVAWYDYGSEVTCGVGEKFKVDFGSSVLIIT